MPITILKYKEFVAENTPANIRIWLLFLLSGTGVFTNSTTMNCDMIKQIHLFGSLAYNCNYNSMASASLGRSYACDKSNFIVFIFSTDRELCIPWSQISAFKCHFYIF